jgi:hypothetical protein
MHLLPTYYNTRATRWVVADLLTLCCAGAASPARAQRRCARATVAETERRNETAVPSLSAHVHEVQRITDYLADALRLSTAQRIALQTCTVAERSDLLLANSETDTQAAQARYLANVRRVLTTSQLRSYLLLRQQLEGTLLPLDGLGLAAR